jgi:tRNA threonylcarbamoyladenosine biosynthesis protein TsaE
MWPISLAPEFIKSRIPMTEKNPKTLQFVSDNEADTIRLGEALAAAFQPGCVVALLGNLGAGKTRLVQAIANALGIDREDVTSPTFVLIQEYDGNLPIFHFDAYRLRDSDQFLELGADELMASQGICLIEWAERVGDVLPDDLLRIEIEIEGPTRRLFRLSGSGPKSNEVVQQLAEFHLD